jgi:hypothetical protein
MNSNANTTNLALISTAVTMVAFYRYLYKQMIKNKEEFHKCYEENRDTTRPGNKSFGLNYGYKTDMAIEEMLDTGDVVFMQRVCYKTFSFLEMSACYGDKLEKSILSSIGIHKSDWDTVGLLFRDKYGPRVLFYFANEIYDLDYGEVLSLPFFQDISARKLKTKDKATGKVGNDFRAHLVNENQEKGLWVSYQPADIIVKYWKKAGVYKEVDGFKPCVENIDKANPEVLDKDKAEYSEPIILRTELSKIEVKNY